MALPCLDTEPVVWVAQPSACCMPLVMPLGHVILGLGKGFFKDFESFFFFHSFSAAMKLDCWRNLVKQ